MQRRRFTPYATQPHCVDLKLYHTQNTEQVFWSAQGNSYVLADNPNGYWSLGDVPCDLLSINGHGEIRWEVTSEKGNTSGDVDAAKYFQLTWWGPQ